MQNDKYRTLLVLSGLVSFLLITILKQHWLLIPLGIIAVYVYYRRLKLIPKEDRLKAVLPTIIGISLITVIMLIYLNI